MENLAGQVTVIFLQKVRDRTMKKAKKEKETKLDILNRTRDRTPIPRPAVFRDKKKYDQNAAKDELRKGQD